MQFQVTLRPFTVVQDLYGLLPLCATEQLSLRHAGSGSRTAAGRRRDDREGEKWHGSGQVRTLSSISLCFTWPILPCRLFWIDPRGTIACAEPPVVSVCSTMWPSQPNTHSKNMEFKGNTDAHQCNLGDLFKKKKYLPKRTLLFRVLVVDWDIHHGQGVQYAFEDDPRCAHWLYFFRFDKNFPIAVFPQCALFLMAPLWASEILAWTPRIRLWQCWQGQRCWLQYKPTLE